MTRRLRILGALVSVVVIAGAAARTQEKAPQDLSVQLMQSTFKIEGLGSVGTTFIVGRPLLKEPGRMRYVLVTADHVLRGMAGEVATLHLRTQKGASQWERQPWPLRIRDQGRELWIKHPNADVAVMYLAIPDRVVIPLVSTTQFADDQALMQLGVHPGDEVICLGYPFGGESSPAGFPILRAGRIASFPLLPTAETKTFLLDFPVFDGNSGGPVYLVPGIRSTGGGLRVGGPLYLIGMVMGQFAAPEQISTPVGPEIRQQRLGLAAVVHASLIKQAIESLPPPDQVPDGGR